MNEILYHPDSNTISGAEHHVISEYPRYVELLSNPSLHDGEWRALANVDNQLCVVVVRISPKKEQQ